MSPLVFITGASSGIGQALALQAYRSGATLALVARRSEEVQNWAIQQGLAPERVRIWRADVAEVSAMAQLGRECLAELGTPDVVIANAGISIGMDSTHFEDLQVMRRTFETNNVGLAATFHPFIKSMQTRGSGSLVGIASVAAIRGLPGHGAYCASKAAVVAYCESLRGECRPYGVKVLTLLPGYVDTPLTQRNRYAMPFLLSAEEFARRAWRAIQAQKSYCVIPWQMGGVAKLMRLLPNPWLDRLFAGRPRKHRQDETNTP